MPEIKLTYSTEVDPANRRSVILPDLLYDVLREWWDQDTIELNERFVVVMIDGQSRLIGVYEHTVGGSKSVMIDCKLIMAAAIKSNASSMAIAHNHPSGKLNPSSADIALTRLLATIGNLHGIPVVEHMIARKRPGYYSFAESNPSPLFGYNLSELTYRYE